MSSWYNLQPPWTFKDEGSLNGRWQHPATTGGKVCWGAMGHLILRGFSCLLFYKKTFSNTATPQCIMFFNQIIGTLFNQNNEDNCAKWQHSIVSLFWRTQQNLTTFRFITRQLGVSQAFSRGRLSVGLIYETEKAKRLTSWEAVELLRIKLKVAMNW